MSRAAVKAAARERETAKTLEERVQHAAEWMLATTLKEAESFGRQQFGAEAGDPYVAYEEFEAENPPWNRIAVDVGPYTLNYQPARSGSGGKLSFLTKCPECTANIALPASSYLGLAAAIAAPIVRCATCREAGRVTRVSVLTGERYSA